MEGSGKEWKRVGKSGDQIFPYKSNRPKLGLKCTNLGLVWGLGLDLDLNEVRKLGNL